MASSKLNFKVGIIIASAATVAVGAVVGYYIYRRRRFKQAEDLDEGIGDVDSIVSEEEVEVELQKEDRSSLGNAGEGDAMPNTEVSETDQNFDTEGIEDATVIEASHPQALKPAKILVLGLNRSGKSNMLKCIAHQRNEAEYAPTVGFNAVQMHREDFYLIIMEVGGAEKSRKYWKNFTNETSVLVYVVDGTDKERFEEAKCELKQLLDEASLQKVPCLLIANKQHETGFRKIDEIFDEKDLNDIGNKGVSSITLLNTSCLPKENNFADGDVILNVIVSILKDDK